jgi:hypothetical protein
MERPEVDDGEAFEGPLARILAVGQDATRVAEPEASEPDSGVLVDDEGPPERTGARNDVQVGRVGADRLRSAAFPCDAVGGRCRRIAGSGWYRGETLVVFHFGPRLTAVSIDCVVCLG